jgi:murein tripeptide amidase MpaA
MAKPLAEFDFTRYMQFGEMTGALHALAENYAGLCRLQSIGNSYEGRDLWLMTLTNGATGSDLDKPAYWIDANIHAAEVTGSATALYTIKYLLENYGSDAQVTHLLDTRTFYILPRHTPDGAERILTTPYRLRSSTRLYPHSDEPDGLEPQDLDGDGAIRLMRFVDPNGDWKVSSADPRLLVKRLPEDYGGTYYSLLTEGTLKNYDGYLIKVPPFREGLDLNRNYPYDWQPEHQQAGAGDYPLSEPETRAVVKFWDEHRNIAGSQSYHTFSGVILRPYSAKADDAFSIHDLDVYKLMGKRGKEYTGYPDASIYHGFRYTPKTVLHGAFLDWAYEHRGVFSISTELWDTIRLAGVEKRDFIEWLGKDRSEEDELKVFGWMIGNIPEAFKDWTPLQHPQLGAVEVGGWDFTFSWQNPPPGSQFLQEIMHGNMLFSFACCAMSARLELPLLEVLAVAPGVYKLTAIIENSGFLPTYTTTKAQERKLLKPLTVKLEIPEGSEIVNGLPKYELPHLEGRSNKLSISPFQRGYPSDHRAKLEWVIKAEPGSDITIEAYAERAGRVRKTVLLGARG